MINASPELCLERTSGNAAVDRRFNQPKMFLNGRIVAGSLAAAEVTIAQADLDGLAPGGAVSASAAFTEIAMLHVIN